MLRGHVSLDVLVLKTPDRVLKIPRDSIRSLRYQYGAVEVRLFDGQVITGIPEGPTIVIDLGTFGERVEWQSIATVELEPPAPPVAVPSAPGPTAGPTAPSPASRSEADAGGFLRLDVPMRSEVFDAVFGPKRHPRMRLTMRVID